MTYLMNWGDQFVSHQYVSVYWCQLANVLKQVFPHLRVGERQVFDDGNEDNTICDLEKEVCKFFKLY